MKEVKHMDESKAREILSSNLINIGENNSLHSSGHYVDWYPTTKTATLDDEFTADELEAIAWWMRNKNAKS